MGIRQGLPNEGPRDLRRGLPPHEPALGQHVYLHLFRDAAATLWSAENPEAILSTRDLLGHRSIDTTDQQYRHAQTVPAARQYALIIERRIGPAASTRPVRIQLTGKRRNESCPPPE
jgi:integrase